MILNIISLIVCLISVILIGFSISIECSKNIKIQDRINLIKCIFLLCIQFTSNYLFIDIIVFVIQIYIEVKMIDELLNKCFKNVYKIF
ncbi:hypothetical protein UMC2_33711 [[Clostridium] sordellii]|uniref:hypothetical protein n=1 Tax=Paraclostridium sordellii TaxID=1505 RepID=UPI0002FE0FBA|nr:hypothetical protein [Paeniclostridium sordellii]CEK36501.1 hypothetical protein UMC2_33711 [[Clostridium] sordellii] [Paeniclostridium sordellii]